MNNISERGGYTSHTCSCSEKVSDAVHLKNIRIGFFS